MAAGTHLTSQKSQKTKKTPHTTLKRKVEQRLLFFSVLTV